MLFEDESAPLSNLKDESDFFISSIFDVEILIQNSEISSSIQNIKAIAALLNIDIDILVQEVKNDWLNTYEQNQKPVIFDRFSISNAYNNLNTKNKKCSKINLNISASNAFGSGEHQSTKACLYLIYKTLTHNSNIKNVLDVGCGSGILSIACKKIIPSIDVLGLDIEKEAVIQSIFNAKKNNIMQKYLYFKANGFKQLNPYKKFDLILANILARPLVEMSKDFKNFSASGGLVILAGFLGMQKNKVLNSFLNNGFYLKKDIKINDWHTLLLQNKQY